MLEFKHGKIRVECETTDRKATFTLDGGFNHRAKLYYDGIYIRKDIRQYNNRSWERFTYQSVLIKVFENACSIPGIEKLNFSKFFDLVDKK